MENVIEIFRVLSDYVWPHWMGMAYIFALSVIAEVVKSSFLTPFYIEKYRVVYWVKRLFPLVLLVTGAVTGIVLSGEVAPGVNTLGNRVLYFMACSCFTIVAYDIFKQWVKRKYGVDLRVGDSTNVKAR